jgi:repressor LexA
MVSLTAKQIRVLRFYRDYRAEHGIAPTLDEAAEVLDCSKITVHEHLRKLEEKGAIRRDPHRARSVAILYDPDAGEPIEPEMSLPILGTIAAGAPIEALENREDITLRELVPHGPDHYLLRVQGDSMIEDHIADGDLVIIQRRTTADNGDIVVAIVDDQEEATLKRFYRERGRVRLQPANAALEPIFPRNVEIRGVLRGVIREY